MESEQELGVQPLEDPALALSTLANLKVHNSLLVKATGGAVGEIYFFTRHLYWLLTSAENWLTSLSIISTTAFTSKAAVVKMKGVSPYSSDEAACLQFVVLFLLCNVASSPLVYAQTSNACEPHKKIARNQWKQPTDLSKLTEISRKTHWPALHQSGTFW